MVKNLIFGRFWTLSAKVVTRGAPWVPRHEDPTFLLCLKPLIPYNQGIWAKNAIFEMCQRDTCKGARILSTGPCMYTALF